MDQCEDMSGIQSHNNLKWAFKVILLMLLDLKKKRLYLSFYTRFLQLGTSQKPRSKLSLQIKECENVSHRIKSCLIFIRSGRPRFQLGQKKERKRILCSIQKAVFLWIRALSEDLWLVRQQKQVQQDFNQCCCLVTLLEAV